MPEHAEPITLIRFASASLDFAVTTCRFARAWASQAGLGGRPAGAARRRHVLDHGPAAGLGHPGGTLLMSDDHAAKFEAGFLDSLAGMMQAVHANAKDKGFWESDRSDAEAIALMHAELSETLESIRNGHPPDHHCPEFSNTEVEFADLVIRVMDTCAARGYRLGDAIVAKHRFNLTRPAKHGKAF